MSLQQMELCIRALYEMPIVTFCVLLFSVTASSGDARLEPLQSLQDKDVERLINWRKRYVDQWLNAGTIMHDTLVPCVAGSVQPETGWAFIKGAFADTADLLPEHEVRAIAIGVINGVWLSS